MLCTFKPIVIYCKLLQLLNIFFLLTILSFASSVSGSVFFMYNVQQLEEFKKAFKCSVPDFKIIFSSNASSPK